MSLQTLRAFTFTVKTKDSGHNSQNFSVKKPFNHRIYFLLPIDHRFFLFFIFLLVFKTLKFSLTSTVAHAEGHAANRKHRCKQTRYAANKKETLQTKKKRCKQKRKRYKQKKKGTEQTKKKRCKQKNRTLQTKKGTAGNIKKGTLQIKKRNAANKKE